MIWLLTLVIGLGVGSKRAFKTKALLHGRFWTSANLMFQNYGNSGLTSVQPSYPLDHVGREFTVSSYSNTML